MKENEKIKFIQDEVLTAAEAGEAPRGYKAAFKCIGDFREAKACEEGWYS